MKPLTIITRRSPLALWQANFVKAEIQKKHPNLSVSVISTDTDGDKMLNISLAKIGGKGLFVKSLETELLNQKADIAVHSLKDMPSQQPEGLRIEAILKRADPRDALISQHHLTLFDLPPMARIGTSSLRRESQLLANRSDLRPMLLRGNINTRLKALQYNQYDAIVLAASGLKRLQLDACITELFSVETMLPAIGQGALCIECREDDHQTKALIAPLNDPDTTHCVLAERSLLRALEGNCQSPIAGYATLENHQVTLVGKIVALDGKTTLQATATLPKTQSEPLGIIVANQLRAQGAQAILDACQQ